MDRYNALLKISDMACAHAAATGADQRSDFWETLAAALEDDCPMQSAMADIAAGSLRTAERARHEFLSLVRE